MTQSRRRKTSLFATEVGLAGMHTFMTLWYRLPMFASGAAPPELGRMVSEKAAAAFEGALDAQAEMLRIAGQAATGKLQFADLAGAPADIAAAGLRPAFRRVKANSKRLHRSHAR